MNFKTFLRLYKFHFLWLVWAITSVVISVLIQSYIQNINYFEPQISQIIALLVIAGFSFLIVFTIFTFVKIYQKGKKIIDQTIDDQSISFKNIMIFLVLAIIININIVLLIRTGALDYVFVVFQPAEVIKDIINSFTIGTVEYAFISNFDQNLLFRYSFLSIGPAILLLLSYIRFLQRENNPTKFSGTRTLMVFFFLSSLAIVIKVITSNIGSFTIDDFFATLHAIGLGTLLIALIIYVIDRFLFSRIMFNRP